MQEINDAKKDLKEIIESKFINGNTQYRILNTKSKSTIYVKTASTKNYIELCHYTDSHENFLQALPLITNSFESLEASLKEYYNYANLPEYEFSTATEKVSSLCKSLKKFHPFFRHQDSALLYIRSVLIYYHYKSINYRFLIYLETHLPTLLPNLQDYRDSDLLIRSEREQYESQYNFHLNSLKKEEKNFFIYDRIFMDNLFHPIYQLLYPHPNENGRLENSLNDLLTNYPKYFSKGLHFNLFLFEDTRNSLKLEFASQRILWRLKIINDIFSDYFSIFTDALHSGIITNGFQQYALLLTNNSLFYRMVSSCTVYPTYQSMHKIINYHQNNIFRHEYSSQKNGVASIIRHDNDLRMSLTDNLFERIKDSLDSTKSVQQQLADELETYYPSNLGEYSNVEIIEFEYFEQLLALELLDIISKNAIIQKCKYCGCFFITAAKNRKYCNEHKNSQILYQRDYEKRTISDQSELQKIYKKYDSCFRKRLTRKKISAENYCNWSLSASELIQKYTSQNISSNSFSYDLNKVCKKHHINPPRNYTRSH